MLGRCLKEIDLNRCAPKGMSMPYRLHQLVYAQVFFNLQEMFHLSTSMAFRFAFYAYIWSR